jgi:hypothetical protein
MTGLETRLFYDWVAKVYIHHDKADNSVWSVLCEIAALPIQSSTFQSSCHNFLFPYAQLLALLQKITFICDALHTYTTRALNACVYRQ